MELAKLRDAFLAHARAASIMRCWAGDATQMPCVGVECANTEVTARGLVVGGAIVDGDGTSTENSSCSPRTIMPPVISSS